MHDLFTRGIGADGKLRPSKNKPRSYIRKPRLVGFLGNGILNFSLKLQKSLTLNLTIEHLLNI